MTVALLAVGIGASLLKGADWEEATALAIVLAAMLPARRVFYRRASMFAERLEPGWLAAILVGRGRVDLAGRFRPQARPVSEQRSCGGRSRCTTDAPGSSGRRWAPSAACWCWGWRGFCGTLPRRRRRPIRASWTTPPRSWRSGPTSHANLALLGDKSLLFSESGRGMLMYGVAGRSWVAMGDPVGPPAEQLELAWRFHELAQRHGGWTVFYEVGVAHLPLYIDLGLTLLKLGEEAFVPLAEFSLDGPDRRALRRTQRQMERDGVTFEVVPQRPCPAAAPRAPGDFGCLAPRKAHAREGLLARVLRRGLPLAIGRCRRRASMVRY